MQPKIFTIKHHGANFLGFTMILLNFPSKIRQKQNISINFLNLLTWYGNGPLLFPVLLIGPLFSTSLLLLTPFCAFLQSRNWSLPLSADFLLIKSFWLRGVAIFLLITLKGALCTVWQWDCTLAFKWFDMWFVDSKSFTSALSFRSVWFFPFALFGMIFTVNFVLYGKVWYLGSDFDTAKSLRISVSSCCCCLLYVLLVLLLLFRLLFEISWVSWWWSKSALIWLGCCWYKGWYVVFYCEGRFEFCFMERYILL